MSDLVERLQKNGRKGRELRLDLCDEAAAEIIRLRTLLGRCGFCDAPLEGGVCPYEVSQEDARAFVEHASRRSSVPAGKEERQ